MKAIEWEATTGVLKAPKGSDNVYDLPITNIKFSDGICGVESCWELSDEEIEILLKTKRIYLCVLGNTHPPLSISVKSEVE